MDLVLDLGLMLPALCSSAFVSNGQPTRTRGSLANGRTVEGARRAPLESSFFGGEMSN